MKKEMFLIFAVLIILSFSITGCGTLFSTRSSTVNGPTVAEGAEVPEVPDVAYEPRRAKNAQRAEGNVYAFPAEALNLRDQNLPPPVYAISGVKNHEINEGTPWEVVDVIINLPAKESFAQGLLEGTDVAEWVLNLPLGLEARAHLIKKGATTAKIYISGTPEVTAREYLQIVVPGKYLKSGADYRKDSPTEENHLKSWEEKQTQSLN